MAHAYIKTRPTILLVVYRRIYYSKNNYGTHHRTHPWRLTAA